MRKCVISIITNLYFPVAIYSSLPIESAILTQNKYCNLKRGINTLWQSISLLLKLFSKLVIARSTSKGIIFKQNVIIRLICNTKRGIANLQAYLQWRWNSSACALRIPHRHTYSGLYDYGLISIMVGNDKNTLGNITFFKYPSIVWGKTRQNLRIIRNT